LSKVGVLRYTGSYAGARTDAIVASPLTPPFRERP
jgi:hypothetical protein